MNATTPPHPDLLALADRLDAAREPVLTALAAAGPPAADVAPAIRALTEIAMVAMEMRGEGEREREGADR